MGLIDARDFIMKGLGLRIRIENWAAFCNHNYYSRHEGPLYVGNRSKIQKDLIELITHYSEPVASFPEAIEKAKHPFRAQMEKLKSEIRELQASFKSIPTYPNNFHNEFSFLALQYCKNCSRHRHRSPIITILNSIFPIRHFECF